MRKRRVIIFFVCLVAMTWFANHVFNKATDSLSDTMASDEIEDIVEEMINDRYGSLQQALALSKRNYTIHRWLKLYD